MKCKEDLLPVPLRLIFTEKRDQDNKRDETNGHLLSWKAFVPPKQDLLFLTRKSRQPLVIFIKKDYSVFE